MVEIIVESITEPLVGLIIAVILSVIALAVNKVHKLVKNVFGIELAEKKTKHVAQVLIDTIKDHDELYIEVLNIVEERLSKQGLKFENGELADIVYSTIKELAKEDGD